MTIKPIVKAPKHEPKPTNDAAGGSLENGPNGNGSNNNSGGAAGGGAGGSSNAGSNNINGDSAASLAGGAGGLLGVGTGSVGKVDGIVGGGGAIGGLSVGGNAAGSALMMHHRRRRHNSPHKRHNKRATSSATASASAVCGGGGGGVSSADNAQQHSSTAGSKSGGLGVASLAQPKAAQTANPNAACSSNSLVGLGLGGNNALPTNADLSSAANAVHGHTSANSSGSGSAGGSVNNSSADADADTASPDDDSNTTTGYNSGDEHIGPKKGAGATVAEWQARDERFVRAMHESRGFAVAEIGEDGACLFRSISLQLYGDQDMHEVIRQQTMDYIYKNREYFAQFVTEDIGTYVLRKRNSHAHGNHIEIQAMSEMFNRPVELYCYQTDPINIFNSDQLKNGYEPLRLSYQRGSHYNAVLNPYKASVGVGLGLAGYSPTRPEQRAGLRDAVRLSEDLEIEQTMFEDKLKTTDWEATNVAIEEQIARESYLQWCRDNMRGQQQQRERVVGPPTVASMAAAGLDGVGGKSVGKCSDDDSLEDGSSFGSDSELKMDPNSTAKYGSLHYAKQQQPPRGSHERRRKRRRCTAAAAAGTTTETAGPSTRSGNTTPPKQVRLDGPAAAPSVNTTPTDDLPGTSRQAAVASTSSSSSSSTSSSSAAAAAAAFTATTSTPVSSFYHELLEATYSDDFAAAGGRQLTEEQMLQKALQMSRLDFMQQQHQPSSP